MEAPKIITYKVLMMVYGFDLNAAQHKLSVIRAVLGKKRFQSVLIQEFCKAENVDSEIFNKSLEAEVIKLTKKF